MTTCQLARDACPMPHEPQPYGLVLAANIAAARTRLRLRQAQLAQRMTQLGWRWYPQTVSEAEAGRRAIRADELLGLSIALETTIAVLTTVPLDVGLVGLPSGDLVSAERLAVLDDTARWDGDELRLAEPRAASVHLDAQLAEKRRELRLMEEYVAGLRRQAGADPAGQAPDPDSGAEDIPVRRPEPGRGGQREGER
jgi:transcriptional regulator with XRE-family HTH domain